ncbi:MAG: Gfo/Idh/MocA family oxidoreductase, partial [Rhodobiaceae bacterium]
MDRNGKLGLFFATGWPTLAQKVVHETGNRENGTMRFGILGDAKIAREKLLPAIRGAGHEVTHIGRRDASAGADPVWGEVTVCSYDDLLASPDVDAIYNPLPNHLHVPMAIRALEAGKPVLSEKPLALSQEELDAVEAATASTGRYLYDGYMVRYHPQWAWIRDIDVGRRKQISAHFSYPPQPAGNIRNVAAWGGGPIWDIGCYCLMSGLMLFDGTPELVSVIKEAEDTLDVEKSATAIIDFGDGQVLHFTCSSGSSLCQSVQLVGTDGWARLDVPFNPPPVTTGRWAHHDHTPGGMLGLGVEIAFDACDQYQLMVEDFAHAVAEGRKADLTQSRHLTRILGAMVAA